MSRASFATGEVVLSVGLFLAALVARLPHLMLIPQYLDEGVEVLWGLDIALGQHLPLTAADPYYGPFFPYLMALLFRLFGTSILLPRLTVAIAGAFVVVAVYWLGRLMGGRVVGLVAAGVALSSPMLVVLSSHYGWSSSLTPLFLTLTLLTLTLAERRRSVWLFALCGLCATLMLHSHPTSAVALVGIVLWYVTRSDLRTRLRSPAPYVGLGLFLLGYAPMLVSNVGPDSPMLREAALRSYAFEPTLAPLEYAPRLLATFKAVVFLSAGGLSVVVPRPLQALVLAMLMGGGLAAWQSNRRLVPLVALSTVVLLPIVVKVPVYRYMTIFMPLGAVLIGVVVDLAVEALRGEASRQGRDGGLLTARATRGVTRTQLSIRRAAQVFVLCLPVVFIAYQFTMLARHYQTMETRGLTNKPYFGLLDAVKAHNACAPDLYLEWIEPRWDDAQVSHTWFGVHAIDYILTLERCAYQRVSPSEVERLLAQPGPTLWLIQAHPPGELPLSPRLQAVTTVSIPPTEPFHIQMTLYRSTRGP